MVLEVIDGIDRFVKGGEFTRFFSLLSTFCSCIYSSLTKMSGMGLHIVDPRILSDQVGDDDSDADHHHHHLHSIL